MALNRKDVKIRVLFTLLVVFSVTILPLQAAGAQSSNPNGLIPAGETIQGSQFIFAPQISIEGTVDGDVFAFGQDVNITGEIKGSLFVLSTTAVIEGQLEGDLFAASPRLTLEPNSNIGRSAYILAGIVNMLPGSQIGRDLYLIGLSGEISGTVGRYQRVHLGIVEILEMLVGENGLLSPLLPEGFRLPWSGIDNLTARPGENAFQIYSGASGLGLSALRLPALFRPQYQTGSIDSVALGAWGVERLRSLTALFLIGLLLLWLFPRFFEGSTLQLRSQPVNSLWIGVIVFFVGIGVAVLVLALVTALGLFFAAINYWDLAILVWGAGLGGLSLALAIFSLAVGYLSKIIVAYLFGSLILNRLDISFWGRRVWILLLGLVLLVLLLAIPILGWVLSMLTIMFGLGAIFQQIRQRNQPEVAPVMSLTGSPVAEEIAPPVQPTAGLDETAASVEKISEEMTATPSTYEEIADTKEEILSEAPGKTGESN